MWGKNVPLFHASHSPPTQATTDSVHWQLYRGIDLDIAQQENMQAAQFVLSGCRTVHVNITIYFFLVLFSHGAFSKYHAYLVLIVPTFLGFLTTTTEYKFPCAFITFPWGLLHTRMSWQSKNLNAKKPQG
jgi:hypothetical protein